MLSGSGKALLENNFSESELEFTSVRTTINVDDTLLEMARALTGVTEPRLLSGRRLRHSFALKRASA